MRPRPWRGLPLRLGGRHLLCLNTLANAANNSSGEAETGQADLLHSRAQIDELVARIAQALTRQKYPEPSRFAVRLALEEALSNAFRHGHSALPPRAPVHVEYRIGPADLTIRVADQGPGFNPDAIPDPTLDENLERPGGRGIMLMRAYMTRVDFDPPGNTVTLYYRRPRAAEGR